MSVDGVDDALEQRVAGGVALAVVERLQPDDVDVGDDERRCPSAAAVELVVELGEPGRAGPRAGELVVRGAGQRIGEQLAIDERMQALTRGLFAVLRRAVAVVGGARVLLGGLFAPRRRGSRAPEAVSRVIAARSRASAMTSRCVGRVQTLLGALVRAAARRWHRA